MGRLAAFFKVADVNVQWSLVGREWSVGGGVGGPRDGRESIFLQPTQPNPSPGWRRGVVVSGVRQ